MIQRGERGRQSQAKQKEKAHVVAVVDVLALGLQTYSVMWSF